MCTPVYPHPNRACMFSSQRQHVFYVFVLFVFFVFFFSKLTPTALPLKRAVQKKRSCWPSLPWLLMEERNMNFDPCSLPISCPADSHVMARRINSRSSATTKHSPAGGRPLEHFPYGRRMISFILSIFFVCFLVLRLSCFDEAIRLPIRDCTVY